MTNLMKKPVHLGYSMPAEWAPHEGTWLAWPRNLKTWPGGRIAPVRNAYLEMIRALLPDEKVFLLVENETEKKFVRNALEGTDSTNLVFFVTDYVDSWVRDYGPTYLKSGNGERSAVKWEFNAWGGKYAAIMRDTEVFHRESLKPVGAFDAGIFLEGGSIEVNGAGTCLTTEQCLLNPNRNPNLSRSDIEQLLRDYLGVEQILWLKEGVVGDDTDGHIDDIARFTDSRTIVAAYEENENDANYALLNENWRALQSFRDRSGNPWRLVKLPMPAPIFAEGVPLPASYANFYIANKKVLLPVFEDPKDKEAESILRDLFPGRRIIPIPCRDVVYGLGTVHCLSQQVPA